MRSNNDKSVLKHAGLAASVLLLASGAAFAQQQVNLTAAPATATMPDGTAVPMWGYSCDATQVAGTTASCTALNKAVAAAALTTTPPVGVWSPVVITVPTGQTLQINLTNSLSFANGNTVPTSLVIVGQLGGGLGAAPTTTPSPDHTNAQPLTWPIAGDAPGAPLTGVGTTPAVSYNADIPLLLSEIDPVQNAAVSAAVNTAGFAETNVWSGLAGSPSGCGNPLNADGTPNPTYNTCYPPAVNYTPLYYLINGTAFDKTNAAASLFATAPASGVTGTVLVRLVNAGLRMHVPSIVRAQTGTPTAVAGFSLIAEDGNVLPGVPRVLSEVFMPAGKTFDVMMNVPTAGTALDRTSV